ncbi:MAG: Asp23/Gls24 family envelope stress response protein [Firmicutes bacterium]|nr:Asp23/Gls24 family envelope stress response protein [Bacillota bacterium]
MENGKIKIASDVILIIADLAISETNASDMIARKAKGKSLNVAYDGDDLVISVDLSVKYGVKIPQVSEEIQKKVKTSVENMTGLKVKEVNVNVIGMNIEKTAKEA